MGLLERRLLHQQLQLQIRQAHAAGASAAEEVIDQSSSLEAAPSRNGILDSVR